VNNAIAHKKEVEGESLVSTGRKVASWRTVPAKRYLNCSSYVFPTVRLPISVRHFSVTSLAKGIGRYCDKIGGGFFNLGT